MTHSEQLQTWMRAHMPDLAAELVGVPPLLYLARLNALTGAGVRSCDTIEDGSKRFLAALQDLSGEP